MESEYTTGLLVLMIPPLNLACSALPWGPYVDCHLNFLLEVCPWLRHTTA